MKKLRVFLSLMLAATLCLTCIAACAENIVLRVCDWSDSTAVQREQFHKEFMEKNPDITIEYTQLTADQFNSTVVGAIQNGDAPDLFPIPGNLNLAIAVQDGWYLDMEQYVSPELVASFADGLIAEGVHRKDGVLYCLSEDNSCTNSMFFYNKDILEACGLEVPTTFEEFRNACKVVTEKGAGEYYGLIEGGKQANRCEILLRALVQAAGGKIAVTSRALTVNGRAPYDTEEMKMAVELLQGIVEDGSLYPDTPALSAPEARELFAQGKAAFLCQGLWCIGTWASDHPELNYGVMTVPKGAENGYTANVETGAWMGIYAKTKYPEAAARYLEALYSTTEYHYQADVVKAGGYVSPIKGVNEENMVNPVMKEYYSAAMTCIDVPIATRRDAKFYDFYANVVSATPSLASIAQGIISQAIDEPMDYLTMLSDAETAAWKNACTAAGVDFSGLEFENWVAGQPYTEADYAALK